MAPARAQTAATASSSRPTKAFRGKAGSKATAKPAGPKIADITFEEAATSRRPSKGRKSALSRDEILSISERADDKSEVPRDHSSFFAKDSLIHLTWGRLTCEPVKAIGKVRRYRGLKAARNRKARVAKEASAKARSANEPKRFRLLNLPREIRDMIYSYLLIHQKPILLHCDWYAVQNSSPLNHAILRVCWQITLEASCFLYQHNVFYALVRRRSLSWRHGKYIDGKYIPFFRNVVIECMKEEWGKQWAEKTGACIGKLVESDTVLDSLTIVIMPQKVGLTRTLIGLETNATTFADFFYKESIVMKNLVRLQCQVFNLVVKLSGKRKVVLSVDVRHLECNYSKSELTDDQASKFGRIERVERTKKYLEGLKEAVERVVEDWEDAVSHGFGRLMEEGEGFSDGMRLMKVPPKGVMGRLSHQS